MARTDTNLTAKAAVRALYETWKDGPQGWGVRPDQAADAAAVAVTEALRTGEPQEMPGIGTVTREDAEHVAITYTR
jgi:hypothetical protein